MLIFLLIGLSAWIAVATTRRVSRCGVSGMTAGMAAMMAAMGSGLTIGYTVGMRWDLGWATLAGVLAGGIHGLWMGRRFGPMAALDGAGGGVMGGLMGPMLAVMLLYPPLSLLATAWLMLGLQAAFSIGAVYLAVAATGTVEPGGALHLAGRLLGAHNERADLCSEDVPTRATTAPSPRRTVRKGRAQAPPQRGRRESRSMAAAPKVIVRAALVLIAAGVLAVLLNPAESPASVPWPSAASGAPASPPVVAVADPDGVQQVALSLRYPRYEPALIQVKAGQPVRLTLQAIGEPG